MEQNKHVLVKVRLPDALYVRAKLICVKKHMSVPKQITELLRRFVEIHEERK